LPRLRQYYLRNEPPRGFGSMRAIFAHAMLEPFHSLDYVLCIVIFLVGIAAVPLMTAWIR
jgi:hypothetical protein